MKKASSKIRIIILCFTAKSILCFQHPMTMYTSPSTGTSHVIPDNGSSNTNGSPYLYNSNMKKSSRILEQEHHLLEDRTNALLNTPLPLPIEFYSEAKHVMYAWAKSRDLQKKYPSQPAKCALTIETLLKRMIEDQKSFPRLELRKQLLNPVAIKNEDPDADFEVGVNVNMYNALLLAWAESGLGDAAFERCQQILESMHTLAASDSENCRITPNLNTVRNTLYAAASADSYAGLKAEYVLEYVTQQGIITPNAACWDIVLYAWSKSAKSNPGSAQRAQEILDWMTMVSSTRGENDIYLSTKAEHEKFPINRKLQPTLQSYRNVVRAWVKSDDPDGAAKAEQIAWRQYHQFPNLWDIHTWLAVMKAYSRRGNATKAHQILNTCRKHVNNEADIPNVCYALVLNTYSNSPDRSVEAAMAAEKLLTEMMELDKSTNGKIRPNTFCFNIVMHAWSRTRSKGAAKRAQRIFNRMQRLHLKQMEEAHPELVESGLLHSAKEVNGVKFPYRPNSISYHILIKAWAWTRGLRATLKAEKYLDEMEHIYFSENPEHMKPNVRTYTLVMNAWSRVRLADCPDGASRAQSILTRMENIHLEGTMPTLKPDKKCYTCVLNAWSRSRQPNKAQQACAVLQKMEDLYKNGNKELKPDLCLYKTVMNAAAFLPYEENLGQHQRDALDITYQTFMNLEKNSNEFGMVADSVVYCMFLKACRNLMPADASRNSVVKAVFGKCCREGLVSMLVLKELRKCCTQNEMGQILWDDLILKNARSKNIDMDKEVPSLEDLPIEWSRFVKKHQPRP